MTFTEIARQLGISRQRTFAIYGNGMRKLQRALYADDRLFVARMLVQFSSAAALTPEKGSSGVPEQRRPRSGLATGQPPA